MANRDDSRSRAKSQSHAKRLVLFASNKGGVGKTTVCRTVLDLTRRAGRSVSAWDLDPTQSLAMTYQHVSPEFNPCVGVGLAPIYDSIASQNADTPAQLPSETKKWADAIASDADDVFLDVPGGRVDDFIQTFYSGAPALIALAQRNQREVVVASIIGVKRDSIVPFLDAVDLFRDTAHHVVVKNGLWGSDKEFIIFDGITVAGTREFGHASDQAKAYNADVLWFPRCRAIPDVLADYHKLTYLEATTDPRMTEIPRENMLGWLNDVEGRLRGTWLDPHSLAPTANPSTEAVAHG